MIGRAMRMSAAAAILFQWFSGCDCGAPVERLAPCSGVTCSFNGSCITDGITPYCSCDRGYHPEGARCVDNDPVEPCTGVDCTGHGTCRIEEDEPICDCDAGFRRDRSGLLCLDWEPPDGWGWDDVPDADDADPDMDADSDDDADPGMEGDEGPDADVDVAEIEEAADDAGDEGDADGAEADDDGSAEVPDLPTDCTGLADLTPCRVVTAPVDLSYDICVAGACVSPGTCTDTSCNAPPGGFALPDTNQRSCYDATRDPASCSGVAGGPTCESTAFCGQDAEYGWDLGNDETSRFAVTEPAPGEPVVADNVSGLVWQGCVYGLSGTTCGTGIASTVTWQRALVDCDDLRWGGADDWRLPVRHELATIVNRNRSEPSAFPGAFPATPSAFLWTSSAQAGAAGGAWRMGFTTGTVLYAQKTLAHSFRCVRGGTAAGAAGARFTRTEEPFPGEPVVADGATGLVWQGCADGLSGTTCGTGIASAVVWQDALAACERLRWGGFDDWRLPNATELSSIVDDRRRSPAVDIDFFPATPLKAAWSSTTYLPTTTQAVYVDAVEGRVYFDNKRSRTYVRCVRGTPTPRP
ncbi:MAG: DUF1566 domain-containing protein [Myxococcota bacterium]|nr:DUF1566 domain-containing protein [Myxococcota bacterium]